MMDIKVSKDKIIRWVDRENFVYEIESKAVHKDEEGYW